MLTPGRTWDDKPWGGEPELSHTRRCGTSGTFPCGWRGEGGGDGEGGAAQEQEPCAGKCVCPGGGDQEKGRETGLVGAEDVGWGLLGKTGCECTWTPSFITGQRSENHGSRPRPSPVQLAA